MISNLKNFGIKTLNWEKTFTEILPADPERNNFVRQVRKACYSITRPQKFPSPSIVILSLSLCSLLGIQKSEIDTEEFLQMFTGQQQINEIESWSCCYAGHQFGSWAGQLGDGRAITIGELRIENGKLLDVQLKGSGKTPYSRQGDGKAVLRSCIREYLCSEAMFYLGVPTTRALGVFKTGEKIMRDILYDGHPAMEDGALLVRTTESLIRFGTFQMFSAQGMIDITKSLLDYSINRNFPQLKDVNEPEKYFKLFETVMMTTASLVAKWQGIGFVHGVLNTDNMSILGETIDYGPFGFMEEFEPNWTPNTTDREYQRYSYINQPDICQWNLEQLGNALIPFLKDSEKIMQITLKFKSKYQESYTSVFGKKLGFESIDAEDLNKLMEKLNHAMSVSRLDMTMFYRLFADFDIFSFE